MMVRFLILLSVFILSCAGGGAKKDSLLPEQKKVSVENPKVFEDSLAIAAQAFIHARDFINRGQIQVGAIFMQKALEFDPNSKVLHFELVKLLMAQQQDKEAAALANKAIEIEGIERLEWVLLAGSLQKYTGQDSLAIRTFKKALEMEPGNTSALYELVQIYEAQKQMDSLLVYSGQLLPLVSFHPPLMQKYLFLARVLKNDSAQVKILQQAWDTTRDTEWGTALAKLQLEMGLQAEPIEIFYQMLENDPKNEKMTLALANIELSRNEHQKAADLLKGLFNPEDNSNIEYLVRAASYELEGGLLEQGELDLKEALGRDSTSQFAYYLYSVLEAKRKNYSGAHDKIDGAIRLDSSVTSHRIQKALLYREEFGFQKAVDYLESIKPEFEKTLKISMTQGSLLGEEAFKDKELAPELWKQKIEILTAEYPENQEDSKLLFELGATFERLDKIDSSAIYFGRVIQLDSMHHAAMNYYGYSLIDRDMDIELGYQLVEKALAMDPGNSAYLDSKAWYLFKKGQFQEALNILLEIHTNGQAGMKNDPTILEHIAACYQKLGKPEKEKEFLKLLDESEKGAHDEGTTP